MKSILRICFILIAAVVFIIGFVTNFLPIEGSKDMSRMGVEWYQLTHYWYLWVTGCACMIGYYLTVRK